MTRCMKCETASMCRIPDEMERLARVHKAIKERGGHPWLGARIEQYMAMDVCLSSLFGLDDLHAKAKDIRASLSGSDRAPGSPSVALEAALRRHKTMESAPLW